MTPPTVLFDGGTTTVSGLEPGRFGYVRVDVPAGVRGWDVRVKSTEGASPAIAVRRDQLPALNQNNQLLNLPSWSPSNVSTWPTSNQWVGGLDWTGLPMDGRISRLEIVW
jgi:hypothetical protein